MPLSRLIVAFALICGLISFAPHAAAFGIGLQPTTVEIEVEPGDRQRQVINIANVHQEKTISLTIGLADWSLDEGGQIELTPPGENEDSAAEWVRFSPAFITLEPGQAEQIVVDMAAPSRLERAGDHRFALLASTILPEDRGGESGVWKKYQIASLFYLTANPARSAPVIQNSSIVATPDGGHAVELTIENQGNAHARLDGEILISAPDRESERLNVGNLVILNDSMRRYSAPLTAPLPEDAVIEVKLTNSFAPQAAGGSRTLPPHIIPQPVRESAEARRE